MKPVTLVVTSCERHDLLERTLRSFVAAVEVEREALGDTIIVEDSALPMPAWLRELPLGNVTWIANGTRKGQVYSIDRAYAEVKTPFIFHCEDDWQFAEHPFLYLSGAILEQYPEIWTVSLRGEEPNYHPNISDGRVPYKIQEPYWHQFWGGCNWNPGLRRLSDWQRIGCYGRMIGYGRGGILNEQALSKWHLDAGYRIAVLPNPIMRHIGEGRSKAREELQQPKVLIAVPACHRADYGKFQDKRIGHVDGDQGRVRAIRETWAKQVTAHGNATMRFFYGRAPVQSQTDEIFLDVPDDYEHLPLKVQAIYRWALDQGFDYVYKCDDDTFVYVDRLMSSGFERFEYVGYCYPSHGNYITGGAGYWVSRKSMKLLVASEIPAGEWAEDKWVGGVLKAAGIQPVRDARYLPGFSRHYVDLDKLPDPHNYIAFHACTPLMMAWLDRQNPTPTFQLQMRAQGEDHYQGAETFALNLKPIEQVSQIIRAKQCNGGVSDPRRAPIAQVSL